MHLGMEKRGEAKHLVSAKQIMQHDKCEWGNMRTVMPL